MAGPVLGVERVVLDRRVEPEAVAVLAVVEGALERLLATAALAAAATAATTTAGCTLVVGSALREDLLGDCSSFLA